MKEEVGDSGARLLRRRRFTFDNAVSRILSPVVDMATGARRSQRVGVKATIRKGSEGRFGLS